MLRFLCSLALKSKSQTCPSVDKKNLTERKLNTHKIYWSISFRNVFVNNCLEPRTKPDCKTAYRHCISSSCIHFNMMLEYYTIYSVCKYVVCLVGVKNLENNLVRVNGRCRVPDARLSTATVFDVPRHQ